jgi:hypothetical protein
MGRKKTDFGIDPQFSISLKISRKPLVIKAAGSLMFLT